jgi:hypothetical protein
MAGLHARMLEILRVLQAQLLDHPARADVARHGEGNDLAQIQVFETVRQRGSGSLGG